MEQECVRKLSQWEGEPPGEPIPPTCPTASLPTCPSHDLTICSARQEPRPPFPNTLMEQPNRHRLADLSGKGKKWAKFAAWS
ncbi:MAG: hypothetical protein ACO2PL_11325 [Armatimonadota bacterium]